MQLILFPFPSEPASTWHRDPNFDLRHRLVHGSPAVVATKASDPSQHVDVTLRTEGLENESGHIMSQSGHASIHLQDVVAIYRHHQHPVLLQYNVFHPVHSFDHGLWSQKICSLVHTKIVTIDGCWWNALQTRSSKHRNTPQCGSPSRNHGHTSRYIWSTLAEDRDEPFSWGCQAQVFIGCNPNLKEVGKGHHVLVQNLAKTTSWRLCTAHTQTVASSGLPSSTKTASKPPWFVRLLNKHEQQLQNLQMLLRDLHTLQLQYHKGDLQRWHSVVYSAQNSSNENI